VTYNVGCRVVGVTDPGDGAPIPLRLLYPTRDLESVQRDGPYELAVAVDAAMEVAGGRPRTGPFEREGPGHSVPVSPDPRVRALVLLAPACGWYYSDGALAGVHAPILMFTAQHDEYGPHLHTHLVASGVPDPARIDHRVVANAGHHAFQSPFPPSMARPGFRPAQDPPGFDRAAFQPLLHTQILEFLRRRAAQPKDPSDAVPEPGERSGSNLAFGIGGIFAAFGLIFLARSMTGHVRMGP
jgi:hypothetical protein